MKMFLSRYTCKIPVDCTYRLNDICRLRKPCEFQNKNRQIRFFILTGLWGYTKIILLLPIKVFLWVFFDLTPEQAKNKISAWWTDLLYNKDSGLLTDPYETWRFIATFLALFSVMTLCILAMIGVYHLQHCVGIGDKCTNLFSNEQTTEIIEYVPEYRNKHHY